jgi:sugar phosphate isomerase/epimerase
MKRRAFVGLTIAGTAGLSLHSSGMFSLGTEMTSIRLGGPVFEKFNTPEEWIQLHKKLGYKAAYCPLNPDADEKLIRAFREEAIKNNIIIAEVGAWSNPVSPDAETAKKAIAKCVEALVLADKINARCCVNISGSRNPKEWDGPHPENLTSATFDLIVETTRKIIDSANPTRTFFTLEPMPWAYPDSVDSYLRLIKAIDRKRFAVHFDPVNLVTSPQILYKNGEMIRNAIKKLGSYIKSCHAKDIIIREDAAQTQLEEVRPGLGLLDYKTLLTELKKLPEVPLMIEHLNTAEEYKKSADYIRSTGATLGILV